MKFVICPAELKDNLPVLLKVPRYLKSQEQGSRENGFKEKNIPMCCLIRSLRFFSIISCQEAGVCDLIPGVGPSLFLLRITSPVKVNLEEGSWNLMERKKEAEQSSFSSSPHSEHLPSSLLWAVLLLCFSYQNCLSLPKFHFISIWLEEIIKLEARAWEKEE